MWPNCEECARLWKEYARATTAHLRVDSKLRVAALAHDSQQIIALTPELEAAESSRTLLREAIHEHERLAHGKASARGTGRPS